MSVSAYRHARFSREGWGPSTPALLNSLPLAALCDMHPMRALFLIPRNPPPKLKSKKWYVLLVESEEWGGGMGNTVVFSKMEPPGFLPSKGVGDDAWQGETSTITGSGRGHHA